MFGLLSQEKILIEAMESMYALLCMKSKASLAKLQAHHSLKIGLSLFRST